MKVLLEDDANPMLPRKISGLNWGGAKYTTLFNHERAESNSTVLYIPDIIMLFERRNVRAYAAMQSLSKYFVFNFFNTSKEKIYIYIY